MSLDGRVADDDCDRYAARALRRDARARSAAMRARACCVGRLSAAVLPAFLLFPGAACDFGPIATSLIGLFGALGFESGGNR